MVRHLCHETLKPYYSFGSDTESDSLPPPLLPQHVRCGALRPFPPHFHPNTEWSQRKTLSLLLLQAQSEHIPPSKQGFYTQSQTGISSFSLQIIFFPPERYQERGRVSRARENKTSFPGRGAKANLINSLVLLLFFNFYFFLLLLLLLLLLLSNNKKIQTEAHPPTDRARDKSSYHPYYLPSLVFVSIINFSFSLRLLFSFSFLASPSENRPSWLRPPFCHLFCRGA